MRYKRDAGPIIIPGVFGDVPMSRYHGPDLCDGPSISSSGLRKMWARSPAHFYAEWAGNPNRVEQKDSEALTLGRAAHHLLLGEDDFSTLFTTRPAKWDSWRTKEARDWKVQCEAEGRTVLKEEQIEQIRGMAQALAKHPLVANGILNGEIEQTLVWKCKETGHWKKARPDAIPNDSGDFADLKTCIDVGTEALQRTIADYQYHMQGAMICEGWHALTGSVASSFSLVFVEKNPPYCVRVVTLRDDDLARGERQNFAAMQRFAECFKRKEWPGPGGADAEYLSLPGWAQKNIDFELDQLDKQEAA